MIQNGKAKAKIARIIERYAGWGAMALYFHDVSEPGELQRQEQLAQHWLEEMQKNVPDRDDDSPCLIDAGGEHLNPLLAIRVFKNRESGEHILILEFDSMLGVD